MSQLTACSICSAPIASNATTGRPRSICSPECRRERNRRSQQRRRAIQNRDGITDLPPCCAQGVCPQHQQNRQAARRANQRRDRGLRDNATVSHLADDVSMFNVLDDNPRPGVDIAQIYLSETGTGERLPRPIGDVGTTSEWARWSRDQVQHAIDDSSEMPTVNRDYVRREIQIDPRAVTSLGKRLMAFKPLRRWLAVRHGAFAPTALKFMGADPYGSLPKLSQEIATYYEVEHDEVLDDFWHFGKRLIDEAYDSYSDPQAL